MRTAAAGAIGHSKPPIMPKRHLAYAIGVGLGARLATFSVLALLILLFRSAVRQVDYKVIIGIVVALVAATIAEQFLTKFARTKIRNLLQLSERGFRREILKKFALKSIDASVVIPARDAFSSNLIFMRSLNNFVIRCGANSIFLIICFSALVYISPYLSLAIFILCLSTLPLLDNALENREGTLQNTADLRKDANDKLRDFLRAAARLQYMGLLERGVQSVDSTADRTAEAVSQQIDSSRQISEHLMLLQTVSMTMVALLGSLLVYVDLLHVGSVFAFFLVAMRSFPVIQNTILVTMEFQRSALDSIRFNTLFEDALANRGDVDKLRIYAETSGIVRISSNNSNIEDIVIPTFAGSVHVVSVQGFSPLAESSATRSTSRKPTSFSIVPDEVSNSQFLEYLSLSETTPLLFFSLVDYLAGAEIPSEVRDRLDSDQGYDDVSMEDAVKSLPFSSIVELISIRAETRKTSILVVHLGDDSSIEEIVQETMPVEDPFPRSKPIIFLQTQRGRRIKSMKLKELMPLTPSRTSSISAEGT